MLVLSRKVCESIVIGNNVKVTIVDVRGDKVRLGIEAPSDVSIHRQEVYDAIVERGQTPAAVVNKDIGGKPIVKLTPAAITSLVQGKAVDIDGVVIAPL